MGEKDLARLLRGMEPVLHAEPYGFALWMSEAPPPLIPFATVAEPEGLTLVAPQAALAAIGLAVDPWARISLTVHSDLEAVGLTAAFAGALAREGLSANVIAGFHHDHIFVQWDRRHAALTALQGLAIA